MNSEIYEFRHDEEKITPLVMGGVLSGLFAIRYSLVTLGWLNLFIIMFVVTAVVFIIVHSMMIKIF